MALANKVYGVRIRVGGSVEHPSGMAVKRGPSGTPLIVSTAMS